MCLFFNLQCIYKQIDTVLKITGSSKADNVVFKIEYIMACVSLTLFIRIMILLFIVFIYANAVCHVEYRSNLF